MNELLFLAAAVALIGWIAYEIRRAPTERDDMTQADDEAAEQCIAASRPAPLERPHVRANTAYGQKVAK